MNLLSCARRLAARAVVLLVVLGGSGTATAADETPAPRVLAAPAVAGPSCPTCGGAPTAGGCASCGRRPHCGTALLGGHKKAPYVVQLCPGACFGYFQTQWHKWEDVCPLPYQGVGQSDAPRPSPGYIPAAGQPGTLPDVKGPDIKKPDGKGSDAPLPRPVGPMPGAATIPPPPGPGTPK
jgi:hypothetical protein